MPECEHPHWAIIDSEKVVWQENTAVSSEVAQFDFHIKAKCVCRTCGRVDYADFVRTIAIEITLKPAAPDPEREGGTDAIPV